MPCVQTLAAKESAVPGVRAPSEVNASSDFSAPSLITPVSLSSRGGQEQHAIDTLCCTQSAAGNL